MAQAAPAFGRPISAKAVAQLSKQRSAASDVKVPILHGDSSDEDLPRRKYRKRKHEKRCCGNDVDPQTPLLMGILCSVMVLAVLMIAVVVSVYGPAGKAQQIIDNADIMMTTVKSSGVTDIVFNLATNWQANNMTVETLALLDALFHSGDRVAEVILAIEPELVADLANRTSITLNGLLTLAENVISNRGLNINIPLNLH